MTDFVEQKLPYGQPEPETGGFLDGVAAAVKTSTPASAFRAVREAARAAEFEVDPAFDPVEYASTQHRQLFLMFPKEFGAARSAAHADHIAQRVKAGLQEREELGNLGFTGFLGMLAGGVVDPLFWVPLAGWAAKAKQAKTMADVARVGASTAAQFGAVGGLAEMVYAGANPTVTKEDVAHSAAASAVLGGLIGAGLPAYRVAKLVKNKKFPQTVEEAAQEAESITNANPGNVDATTPVGDYEERLATLPDPGGVARTGLLRGPVHSVLSKLSPTTRVANSTFETARKIQAQLHDSGLTWQSTLDGKVAAPMGTVENRVHAAYGALSEVLTNIRSNYLRYAGKSGDGSLVPERAGIVSGLQAIGKKKMTLAQFENEALKASMTLEHSDPAVLAAARDLRRFFDSVGKEAGEVGVIDPKLVGKKTQTNEFYVAMMLSMRKIYERPQQFIDEIVQYKAPTIESYLSQFEEAKTKTVSRLKALKDDLADPTQLAERIVELQEARQGVVEGLQKQYAPFVEKFGPLNEHSFRKAKKAVREGTADKELATWVKRIDEDPNWKRYVETTRELNARVKHLRQYTPPPKKVAAAKKKVALNPFLAEKFILRYAAQAREFLNLSVARNKKLASLRRAHKNVLRSLELLERKGLLGKDKQVLARVKRAQKVLADAKRLKDLDENPVWKEMQEALDTATRKIVNRVLKYGAQLKEAEDVFKAVDVEGAKEAEKALGEKIAATEAKEPPITVIRRPDGSIDARATAKEFLTEWLVRRDEGNSDVNVIARAMLHQEERGSELARIFFSDVPQEVLLKWTHDSADELLRAYARTVLPDIELKRLFGHMGADRILEPLKKELKEKKRAALDAGQPLKPIEEEYIQVERDLRAQIQRLRGQRGLPQDPSSYAVRFGETMRNFAVTRFLGKVLFPSTTDLGKLFQRTGVGPVVDGIWKMTLSRLKKIPLDTRKAAVLYGVAERTLAVRAKVATETFEEVARGGSLLDFSRWASGKTLKLSGLPLVNQLMKELSIISGQAFYNRHLMEWASGHSIPKKVEDAFLQHGITQDTAKRIMEQVRKDPNTYWDDVGNWFENLATWEDRRLARQYYAMLSGKAAHEVVTPGLERPLWADGSELGKVLYQFRGYSFASTQRVLAAGLQHPDSAFAATVVSSLIMGGISFWLRAQIVGGWLKEEVDGWGPGRWLDEMVDQSGIVALLSDGNRVLRTAGIDLLTFEKWLDGTASKPSYTADKEWFELLSGPATTIMRDAGTLALHGARAAFGPDRFTRGDLSRMRRLTPFAGLWQIERGARLLEDQLAGWLNLPRKRR